MITTLYTLKLQLPDARQKTKNDIAKMLARSIGTPFFTRTNRGTIEVMGPDNQAEDVLPQLERYATLLVQTYPELKVQVWRH